MNGSQPISGQVLETAAQPGNDESMSGEDVGLTVDRSVGESAAGALNSVATDSANQNVRTMPASHSDLLADAKRYRKRAQAAEKQVAELKLALARRDQQLHEREAAAGKSQQQAAVDQALQHAGAIDLDAARTLALAALNETELADVQAAVDELKRRKPYLFRRIAREGGFGSGVMAARAGAEDSASHAPIKRAAREAIESGKRIDLLRYLRLRRKAES